MDACLMPSLPQEEVDRRWADLLLADDELLEQELESLLSRVLHPVGAGGEPPVPTPRGPDRRPRYGSRRSPAGTTLNPAPAARHDGLARPLCWWSRSPPDAVGAYVNS